MVVVSVFSDASGNLVESSLVMLPHRFMSAMQRQKLQGELRRMNAAAEKHAAIANALRNVQLAKDQQVPIRKARQLSSERFRRKDKQIAATANEIERSQKAWDAETAMLRVYSEAVHKLANASVQRIHGQQPLTAEDERACLDRTPADVAAPRLLTYPAPLHSSLNYLPHVEPAHMQPGLRATLASQRTSSAGRTRTASTLASQRASSAGLMRIGSRPWSRSVHPSTTSSRPDSAFSMRTSSTRPEARRHASQLRAKAEYRAAHKAHQLAVATLSAPVSRSVPGRSPTQVPAPQAAPPACRCPEQSCKATSSPNSSEHHLPEEHVARHPRARRSLQLAAAPGPAADAEAESEVVLHSTRDAELAHASEPDASGIRSQTQPPNDATGAKVARSPSLDQRAAMLAKAEERRAKGEERAIARVVDRLSRKSAERVAAAVAEREQQEQAAREAARTAAEETTERMVAEESAHLVRMAVRTAVEQTTRGMRKPYA